MRDDLTIRTLATLDEFKACVALQKEIWGEDCSEIVPVSILRNVPRLNGVIGGAFDDAGRLEGMVFGLTGLADDGAPIHWSDMLAVRAGLRNRGLGERLKRWQREVLLPFGIEHMYWTFDPLESKNAYLNFSRLGAVSSEYRRDYYGKTDSPLHAGLPTDRMVPDWQLTSERVRARLAGETRAPTRDEVDALPVLLGADESGKWPRPLPGPASPAGDAVCIAVPADIQALKVDDPGLGAAWREATRMAFEAAFGSGYRVEELVRAATVSWYVLKRG